MPYLRTIPRKSAGRTVAMRIQFGFATAGPAGRARCARSGRSHSFLELRVVLPLVGINILATNGSANRRGTPITK
ncbi:hypothetical protein HDF10_002696 [Edaphobacter lichenicola]|uniref:Uncharacterized protein n=1 Tax=Tunturiibacter lichenicola TaxID=2051959 RepID=A0A7W8J8T2_9BACT|nr:hypothetical protein [Edaphobacter lichenicola]